MEEINGSCYGGRSVASSRKVKLTIHNANSQAKKQIDDIEKFIADKVDVIIVSPFESDSIIPVIEKANAIGIPVIIVDRKVNTSNYTAYLGADNVEVGRIAGRTYCFVI